MEKERTTVWECDFRKYEEARFKMINMADIEAIRLYTGMKEDLIKAIQKDYKKYYDSWSYFAKEFGEKW